MKDSGNVHKKVQEMCDCYTTTDPLKEMSILKNHPDTESAAIKWVALAALHGVNSNAEKISISSGEDGKTTVVAEYRLAELPSPGDEVGRKVFETFKRLRISKSTRGKPLWLWEFATAVSNLILKSTRMTIAGKSLSISRKDRRIGSNPVLKLSHRPANTGDFISIGVDPADNLLNILLINFKALKCLKQMADI